MSSDPIDPRNLADTEGQLPAVLPEIPDVTAAEDDGFDASEYVRQLIARMGSGSDTSAASAPVKPQASRPAPVKPAPAPLKPSKPPVIPSTQPVAPAKRLPLGDAPASLDELPRRRSQAKPDAAGQSQPSVHSVDLKKLREAANMMTSSALHAFDCESLVRRAYSQLALAVGSMVTSLILLSMCDRVQSVAFGASVMMLATAAFATFRYATTTRVLGEKLKTRSP